MTAPTNVRTCYRHPDRVAGISCQRCDRPICPSCMNQASVGFHCPDCAQRGKQKVLQGAASWTTKPVVAPALIGVNVVLFALQLLTRTMEPFSLGGRVFFGDRGLYADGALFGRAVPDEPWRLLTSGFLHSYDLPFGFFHLAMNMYALYMFGRLLEPALGRTRFAALYLTALLGGSLGIAIVESTYSAAGASGAIFGLMGGAVVVARQRGIDLMRSGLVTTLGINLVITFGVPGISIGGHVGGLLAGLVAGLILTEGPARLGSKGELVASGLAVAVGVVFAVAAYALLVGEFGHPLA